MDPRTVAKLRRRARASARNAMELVRLGRLGESYGAPYAIVDEGPHYKLRRYAATDAPDAPVALLVPPLMLTAEIYDVGSDVSAVQALAGRGVVPFVVDFGAPEREAGGMHRTLDDHIKALDRAIDRVRELTGRDVYVLGYSQGGMFCYQAVAYRRGQGVRGVVTFGSPVDIHRGLPAMRSEVTGALARFVEPAISSALDRIEGLPGFLTSTAFKMLSPRKELQSRVEFVQQLHDRKALVRRESRRRFLGGEGFVAWPGPAFRYFFEEFIVHNRMLSGGIVIDGRTLSLADITCPILCFVGLTDELARPAAVRNITRAAPDAEVDFIEVPAGHFGLVVGSRANQITWPTVASWIQWREGTGARPSNIVGTEPSAPADEPAPEVLDEDELGEVDIELELFIDTAAEAVRTAWRRLGDVVESASDAYDAIKWQEPRLRRLAELSPSDKISASLLLAEQAKRSPDATFFLWRDRAFSYREADVRVTNVVKGLWSLGVRPGDRVGVLMGSRPSFLAVVTALGRLGAVAVVAPPESEGRGLQAAFERAGVASVVCDPDLAAACHEAQGRDVLVLGGGGKSRALPEGQLDLEAVDPEAIKLPEELELDAGRARDLSLILLRPSESGELRAAPITNHRWALSALGSAAACTLTPLDTVYCSIPLHHPTGILVSVGAALAAGTRLAVAGKMEPSRFAHDVRRAGATVFFYAGEMLRPLLFEKPSRGDRTLPIRLFAGSGMRPELAARLHERFGIGVMEFYASTSQRVILANASGEKPGALGRKLPGSTEIALVRYDVESGRPVRDVQGRLVRVGREERGLLVSRIDEGDDVSEASPSVVSGAFEPGDCWFVSSDVMREDIGGDYWFVDALSGFVRTSQGAVSTRQIESAFHVLPELELDAAWAQDGVFHAAFVSQDSIAAVRLTEAMSKLAPHERPRVVHHVAGIELTEGFRPKKSALRLMAAHALVTYELDETSGAYDVRREQAVGVTA